MRLHKVLGSAVGLGENPSRPASPPPAPVPVPAAPRAGQQSAQQRWRRVSPAGAPWIKPSSFPGPAGGDGARSCSAEGELSHRGGRGDERLQRWLLRRRRVRWPLLASTDSEGFLVSQGVCQGLGRQQWSLVSALHPLAEGCTALWWRFVKSQ